MSEQNAWSSVPAHQRVGSVIKLTTSLGKTIEGELFSYYIGCYVISQHTKTGKPNFFLVPEKGIVGGIKVISMPKSKPKSVPRVSAETMKHLAARAKEITAKRKLKMGVNVTFHTQNLFDSLSKTLPTKWGGEDNKSIIVLDQVVIEPPYTIGSCSGGDDRMMSQVGKILNHHAAIVNQGRNQQTVGQHTGQVQQNGEGDALSSKSVWGRRPK